MAMAAQALFRPTLTSSNMHDMGFEAMLRTEGLWNRANISVSARIGG